MTRIKSASINGSLQNRKFLLPNIWQNILTITCTTNYSQDEGTEQTDAVHQAAGVRSSMRDPTVSLLESASSGANIVEYKKKLYLCVPGRQLEKVSYLQIIILTKILST